MIPRAAHCSKTGFRSRSLWLLLLSLVGMSPIGCKRSPTRTLIDSEQRRFSAQCDPKGECEVAAEATATAAGTAPPPHFTLWRTGRVVGICESTAQGAPPNVADCRPLVCHADADCPPAQGLPHGVCIGQLCTEPSHSIIVDDAIQLCLAGTGAGPRRPLQVERLALGLNCGSPCQIPKPCRQL